MIGAEVVVPGTHRRAGPPHGTGKSHQAELPANGLVETGGRNGAVLRFLPPLIVSEADIHEILNRFEHAVETACRA